MHGVTEGLITIVGLVAGVAVLSIIVSSKSNTTGVIQATASAVGNTLATAMSPVTGASATINLGYPNSTSGTPNTSLGSPQLHG